MSQVFTFGNVELSHDAEANIVTIVYKGFAKSSDIRDSCEKSLEVIKQHHTYKVLVDQRKMGAMGKDDVLWMANDYYPRVYNVLKRHTRTAMLMPESFFGELTAKVVSSEFSKVVSTTKDHSSDDSARSFSNMEAAKDWLLSSN